MVTRIQEWQNPINLTWINARSNLLQLDAICNWKSHYSARFYMLSPISKRSQTLSILNSSNVFIVSPITLPYTSAVKNIRDYHQGLAARLCARGFAIALSHRGPWLRFKQKTRIHLLWLPVTWSSFFSPFFTPLRAHLSSFLGRRGGISPLVK